MCVVYDCLFPYTVGGGERWYRNVAERLAREGHEVTYLTLRQWERGDAPAAAGRRARGRRRPAAWRSTPTAAAGASCRRCVFGLGVLVHLLRHGRRYDVVDTCAFPYFSLLAAALLRPLLGLRARRRLVRGVERVLLARIPRARGRCAWACSCSVCARACPSARSASPSCTPSGCARRACAGA